MQQPPNPDSDSDPDFGLAPAGPDAASAAVSEVASEVLGLSVEGRVLRAWRFGAGGAPPLLVVGGVHGDEPSSVGAVAELGQRLQSGAVVASGPVWVVPRLNPDGLARGRKNSARDVDLNRNFPAANFRRAHEPGYFPGAEPLSEPETAALAVAHRSRAHRCHRRRARAVRLRELRRARRRVGRAGCRGVRLARARRHRLSDARLAGQLVWHRSRLTNSHVGAAARAARRLSESVPRRARRSSSL